MFLSLTQPKNLVVKSGLRKQNDCTFLQQIGQFWGADRIKTDEMIDSGYVKFSNIVICKQN